MEAVNAFQSGASTPENNNGLRSFKLFPVKERTVKWRRVRGGEEAATSGNKSMYRRDW